MKTRDNLNYYIEAGDVVKGASIDGILLKTHYVRERHEFPIASQDGEWDKTWKRDAWCGTAWHKVGDEMPGWVGRTYRDFMKFAAKNNNNPNIYDFLSHEIIIVETYYATTDN